MVEFQFHHKHPNRQDWINHLVEVCAYSAFTAVFALSEKMEHDGQNPEHPANFSIITSAFDEMLKSSLTAISHLDVSKEEIETAISVSVQLKNNSVDIFDITFDGVKKLTDNG